MDNIETVTITIERVPGSCVALSPGDNTYGYGIYANGKSIGFTNVPSIKYRIDDLFNAAQQAIDPATLKGE